MAHCDDGSRRGRNRGSRPGIDSDSDSDFGDEHISATDSRWHFWSQHVLDAIAAGARATEELQRARPGSIGPSKLRQCLAWLELQGLALWSPRLGWLPTQLGRMRAAENRSALTIEFEARVELHYGVPDDRRR